MVVVGGEGGCVGGRWGLTVRTVFRKMSVSEGNLRAVRAAVLQQEQMSHLNGPSWWPTQSGNPSPFAPN